MPGSWLDGKPVAEAVAAESAGLLAELRSRGVQPTLALVRVGDDEGSVSYARSLERSFARADLGFRAVELPADAAPADLTAALDALGDDPAVHGIILQEPLPTGFDEAVFHERIAAGKDVDGVHPYNAGRLFAGQDDGLIPATALGGMALLDHLGVDPRGRRAVVIGRSLLVGRPLALLLLHRHATVTVCHSRTVDLPAIAREADILAVAVGRAHLVTPEFVRPGAVVLDFGVNFQDGAMCGDVAPAVADQASLTRTPGGTGAVTTAVLRRNLIVAAARTGDLPVSALRLPRSA